MQVDRNLFACSGIPEEVTSMTSEIHSPLLPQIGRIIWLLVGPLALVFLIIGIVRSGTGWLTGLDLAFFLVLGGMCLGRWIEFRGGTPRTSSGEPAGPAVLRHYVLLVLTLGLATWIAANVLGNHILAGRGA
jgi:hypothetical protein